MPPSRKRKGRRPKSIPVSEMAMILAYAELHDDEAASEKFNISTRTLLRRRKAIKEGKAPELAELVKTQKAYAEERCRDLLVETWEKGLKALAERIEARGEDRMNDRDLTGAIHILGNQRVVRDAVQDDDGSFGADSEGSEAQEAESGQDPSEGGEAPSYPAAGQVVPIRRAGA